MMMPHPGPASAPLLDNEPDLTVGRAGRVWEGVLTTTNVDGTVNVAPHGPIAGPEFQRMLLRPFAGSRTHANLQAGGRGVFHLVDDVELLARAAIHEWDEQPALTPTPSGLAERLADCVRWYEFEITRFDASEPRATALAQVVDRGTLREAPGFNRAQGAVVEAAILATRVGLLAAAGLRSDLRRLEIPVQKTGAARELRAFRLIQQYVEGRLGAAQGGLAP